MNATVEGDPNDIPTVPGIYIAKGPGWLDNSWTSVPNKLIRNSDISWDAKAAWAWLASHQAMRFRVTAQMLADAGPRGRNHAYEMVRELERSGWLTRHRLRNPQTGRTDIQVYQLRWEPAPESERTFKPSKAVKRTLPTGFVPVGPVTDPPADGGTDTPRSEFIPDHAGTDRPVPDRPVPGRPGDLTRARSTYPLEDQVLTHQEEHTTADKPPRVDDPPAVVDPDDAAADWAASRRPRSSTKVTDRWNRSQSSPEAVALVNAYCADRPLPVESRRDLLPRVTSLLGQGFPGWAINEGIADVYANGLGLQHLANKVAAAMHRRSAPQRQSVGEQRRARTEQLREQMRALDAAEAAAIEHSGLRAIGGTT